MADKVVWLVDDQEDECASFARLIQEKMQDITVRQQCPPFKNLQDSLPMLRNQLTAGLIVDQRLKETGIATYTGIELAKYVRSIRPKLPVYILTNFPDEDEYGGPVGDVEGIVAKTDMVDSEKLDEWMARFKRHLDVYADILSERAQRFRVLLRKRVSSSLSEEEQKEYDELQFLRISPIVAGESHNAEKLDELIDALQQLVKDKHKGSNSET